MPNQKNPCNTININYIKCLEKNKKTDPCNFHAKIYQICLRNMEVLINKIVVSNF